MSQNDETKPVKSKEEEKEKESSQKGAEGAKKNEEKENSKEDKKGGENAAEEKNEEKSKEKSKGDAEGKKAADTQEKSKSDKEKPKTNDDEDPREIKRTPDGSSDAMLNASQTSTGTRKSKRAGEKGEKGEQKLRIGFMGAGRMTDCMIRGLIKVGKVKASKSTLFVAAKSGRNLDTFKGIGCKTTQRSYDLFGKYKCDVVFLCVHGFVVRSCFKLGGTRPFPMTTNYVPSRKSKYYILSMIGGVPITDVKTVLLNPEGNHHSTAIFHRIAMNASCAYGIGLGAIDVEYDSKKCSPIVRDLLASVGQIVTIDEANMDAACAVGGNGMAIIYYFMSALSDGGFKMGLSKNMAIKMAARVMQVAATAVLESNLNLGELRDACCSPSGAAIYGLAVMEKHDLASGIQSAVDAAYRRIKELAEVDSVQQQTK